MEVLAIPTSRPSRTIATSGLFLALCDGKAVVVCNLMAPSASPKVLDGHLGAITALCFFPLRRTYLISASIESIRIWDVVNESGRDRGDRISHLTSVRNA